MDISPALRHILHVTANAPHILASPSLDYEIIIAGAGPAGVATAVALLRRDPGLSGRVLVLDRQRFPRAKPCGGGLTGHVSQAMAALGLTLDVPSCPAPRALVRYGTLSREVTLGRPVHVIRREEFDASLVRQAEALGAIVWQETPLVDYAVDAAHGCVQVEAGKRRLVARVLVGADGAGSLVRKRLLGHRAQPLRPPIRLFRAELKTQQALPGDRMLYDFTLMQNGLRGYLWVFPVPDGRLNVGLMHYPARGQDSLSGADLVARLETGLRDHGLVLERETLRGWPAWPYSPNQAVATAQVLLVGDAAGIDALTGEGIAVGMEQGLVAGKEVQRALASGDFSFHTYRRALRRATVGRELTLDRRLAWMLYDTAEPERWLSLILLDDELLELYAARVSGTVVLAQEKTRLLGALWRHLLRGSERREALRRATVNLAPPLSA